MKAHTKTTQATMSPEISLKALQEGNKRFTDNIRANRNLKEQVEDTEKGQFPFATILSCIDSRVSSELIFDQGIGDIFSVRIAGNFVNEDILGSMEFACKLAGTRLIVILGHTSCGAIKGACDDAKLGNLTTMLNKLKPAVNNVLEPKESNKRNSSNIDFVNNVAKENVILTIENLRNNSSVLKEMEDKGEIKIIGAMYNVSDGSVEFYE